MITALLTKQNGEVVVREGLNFEEFEDLKSKVGDEFIDIEMEDISDESELSLLSNEQVLHYI